MLNENEKLRALKQRFSQDRLARRRAVPTGGFRPGHYRGVGIGHKNGDPDQGIALRFYVREKLPKAAMVPAEFIDPKLEGFTTDVVVVKPFRAFVVAPRTPAEGPKPGAAIEFQSQNGQGPTGTLGAVLVGPDGKQYGLGANHVLSRNGSVTRQAGFAIIDTAEPNDVAVRNQVIGTKVTFAPLFDGCNADCAMVEPGTGVSFAAIPPADVKGKLIPDKIVDPTTGRPLGKFGFATNWTEGVVADDVADVRLDCGPGLGLINIHDVALVRSGTGGVFAEPGDSGALVFQKDETGYWTPCGLVTGGPSAAASDGTEDFVSICRLSAVIDALNRVLYPDLQSNGVGLQLQFEGM
jgi:hypothetical protein